MNKTLWLTGIPVAILFSTPLLGMSGRQVSDLKHKFNERLGLASKLHYNLTLRDNKIELVWGFLDQAKGIIDQLNRARVDTRDMQVRLKQREYRLTVEHLGSMFGRYPSTTTAAGGGISPRDVALKKPRQVVRDITYDLGRLIWDMAGGGIPLISRGTTKQPKSLSIASNLFRGVAPVAANSIISTKWMFDTLNIIALLHTGGEAIILRSRTPRGAITFESPPLGEGNSNLRSLLNILGGAASINDAANTLYRALESPYTNIQVDAAGNQVGGVLLTPDTPSSVLFDPKIHKLDIKKYISPEWPLIQKELTPGDSSAFDNVVRLLVLADDPNQSLGLKVKADDVGQLETGLKKHIFKILGSGGIAAPNIGKAYDNLSGALGALGIGYNPSSPTVINIEEEADKAMRAGAPAVSADQKKLFNILSFLPRTGPLIISSNTQDALKVLTGSLRGFLGLDVDGSTPESFPHLLVFNAQKIRRNVGEVANKIKDLAAAIVDFTADKDPEKITALIVGAQADADLNDFASKLTDLVKAILGQPLGEG